MSSKVLSAPIGGSVLRVFTVLMFVHPTKVSAANSTSDPSIVTAVRPVQSSNALSPTDSTFCGILISDNPLQYEKAYSPMEVTELGMVNEVSPEQS